jgi:hypothetical protein
MAVRCQRHDHEIGADMEGLDVTSPTPKHVADRRSALVLTIAAAGDRCGFGKRSRTRGTVIARGRLRGPTRLKDRKCKPEAQTWEGMKKHVYQTADAAGAP